jgi:hypothetical protein
MTLIGAFCPALKARSWPILAQQERAKELYLEKIDYGVTCSRRLQTVNAKIRQAKPGICRRKMTIFLLAAMAVIEPTPISWRFRPSVVVGRRD